MDVSVGGRGRTTRCDLMSMRSSVVSSSPLTGSLPFSAMYASMRRFSKTLPVELLDERYARKIADKTNRSWMRRQAPGVPLRRLQSDIVSEPFHKLRRNLLPNFEYSLAQSMVNWGGWREVDGQDLTRRAAPLDFSIAHCGLARTKLFASLELCFSSSQLSHTRPANGQFRHKFCT